MRRSPFPPLVVCLAFAALASTTGHADSASVIRIVDTLGDATPGERFYFSDSGGPSINSEVFVGPAFELSEPTVITEIGGFVNNCRRILGGVPQCPFTSPFVVEIRPSTGGLPDPSVVLATATLSHDDDPLYISYKFTSPNLPLPSGSYFALFAPQDAEDRGYLLRAASIPFPYLADRTTLGWVIPPNGQLIVEETEAAVRVLGIPAILPGIDIKPGIFPNHVEPSGEELIPVALLGSDDFDVHEVDVTTLRFGPAGAVARSGSVESLVPVHHFQDLRDVNLDGHKDLVSHYRTPETGIACWDTEATLTGALYDGRQFLGTDEIITVGCPLAPNLASIQEHIFTPICSTCHRPGGIAPMPLHTAAASYASLVESPISLYCSGVPRVHPGNPDGSCLVWKIQGEGPISGSRMPPPPLPRLSPQEIAAIREWILLGALP